MEADALLSAIQRGDLYSVEQQLVNTPALAGIVADDGTSALLTALYYGHPTIAATLIRAGAPVSIFEAAAAGLPERTALLLTARPPLAQDYSRDGWTALHLAAFFGHAECAVALIDAGASLDAWASNDQMNQPLHTAAAGNHADVVALLLNHGADVTTSYGEGFTALHAAAQNGNLAIVELLLDNEAPPHPALADGRTPLDLAAEQGHLEIVERLRQMAP